MQTHHIARLSLSVFLCLSTAGARPETSPSNSIVEVEGYPELIQLAYALHWAKGEIRTDFVKIILVEMAAAYSTEADLARGDASADSADLTDPADSNGQKWSDAVDNYTAGLRAAAIRLDTDHHVSIRVTADHSLYFTANNKVYLLDGPSQPWREAIVHYVVDRFCSDYDCRDLLLGKRYKFDAPHTSTAQTITTSKSLTGIECSIDSGLTLQFSQAMKMSALKKLCSKLSTEIESLIAAVTKARQRGISINWAKFEIKPAAGARGNRVVLNRNSNVVFVRAPTLAESPLLVNRLRPWLAGKSTGASGYYLSVDHMENLLQTR